MASGRPAPFPRTVSATGGRPVAPPYGQPQVLVSTTPTTATAAAVPRPAAPGQILSPAAVAAQGIVGLPAMGQPVSPIKVQTFVGGAAPRIISPGKVQSIVAVPAAAAAAGGHGVPPLNLLGGPPGAKMPIIVNNSSGKGTLYVAGNPMAGNPMAGNPMARLQPR